MATFSLCPESVESRSRLTGVATTVETGHSRARQVVERPFRSWTLTWAAARRETVNEIRRQLELTLGGALTLDWTPPGESSVEVRLGRPGIRTAWVSASIARVTVDFEEVR
ncbi:MAG TPA: hypothetical protein PKW35_00650 [Nannocystaceae bacterium]|nr:hypothetical protein [Nannocystaceae bacterium]